MRSTAAYYSCGSAEACCRRLCTSYRNWKPFYICTPAGRVSPLLGMVMEFYAGFQFQNWRLPMLARSMRDPHCGPSVPVEKPPVNSAEKRVPRIHWSEPGVADAP